MAALKQFILNSSNNKPLAIKKYLPVVIPLCVFVLPLFYHLYPVENGYSGVTNSIFLCLAVILLLYAICSNIKTSYSLNYVDVSALGFLGYTLVNSILKRPEYALSNDNILLVAVLTIYPALKQSLQNKSSVNILSGIVLATGLIIQLYGLLQLLGILPVINPVYKATGLFFNPNIFCAYLTLQCPLAIYGVLNYRQFYIKLLCGIYCLGIAWFDVLLSSRAAVLALLIAVIFLLAGSTIQKGYKLLALGISSLLLIVMILISVQIKTGSSNGRLLIWKISSGMFWEHPVSGSGFGTYKSKYNLLQAQYFKNDNYAKSDITLASENYEPFNDFLGIGIEEGVIGLLLLIILVSAIFLTGTNNKILILYFRSSILIFGVISFFSYPYEEPVLLIGLFALIAAYSALINQKAFSFKYLVNFSSILVAGLCFNRYCYTDKWLTLKNNGQTDVREYDLLYPQLNNDPVYLLDYARLLGAERDYRYALQITRQSNHLLPTTATFERLGLYYDKCGQPDSAINNFKEATLISPGKFIPQYILYNYYKLTNNTGLAKQAAKGILSTVVKVPSLDVDIIRRDAKTYLTNGR